MFRCLITFLKHCVGHTRNIYALDPTYWPPFCVLWIKINQRTTLKWDHFKDYINYFLSFLWAASQVSPFNMLLQAHIMFLDRYFTLDRNYLALRVPQSILGFKEISWARMWSRQVFLTEHPCAPLNLPASLAVMLELCSGQWTMNKTSMCHFWDC